MYNLYKEITHGNTKIWSLKTGGLLIDGHLRK